MSYTLYITRKENYFDEDPRISEEEWMEVVEKDKTLKSDEHNFINFNNHQTPIIQWTNPETGNIIGLYYYNKGDIHIDHLNKEDIVKLKEIATALNAKVQGDEGEIY